MKKGYHYLMKLLKKRDKEKLRTEKILIIQKQKYGYINQCLNCLKKDICSDSYKKRYEHSQRIVCPRRVQIKVKSNVPKLKAKFKAKAN